MKKLWVMVAVAALLSGCVVYPDAGHGRKGGHRHGHDHGKAKGHKHGHGTYHCPPGQAKKGRC